VKITRLILFAVFALVLGLWLGRSRPPTARPSAPPSPRIEQRVAAKTFHRRPLSVAPRRSEEERQLLRLQHRLDRPGARPHEALLKFPTAEAMRAFLARAKKNGLAVLGQIAALSVARIGYGQLDQLRLALQEVGTEVEVDANFIARIPDILQKEDRPAGSGTAAFNGDGFLEAVGATGDRATWGQGVTVAVVDSGVENHPTFAANQITHVDLVNDGQVFSGHGTAMASLIAGQNWQAAGVAPAAQILDIRVADAQGVSESFTLASGIMQAADAGAQIINISLGSYGDSAAVGDAIIYAQGKGAVILAAAGNDAAGHQLNFPASVASVISVGGVDANFAQAYFSNSGVGLDVVAPAVGIQSAYGKTYLIVGDGTSQATAIVSGVLAQAIASGATTSAGAADWLAQHAKQLGLPAERVGSGLVQVK
jgi:thermitase